MGEILPPEGLELRERGAGGPGHKDTKLDQKSRRRLASTRRLDMRTE